MKESGTALICGDGAVKGGFVAGAVTALQAHFPKEMSELDVVAATSASVGSMFYFLSEGENHKGRYIWTSLLSSKKFINYRGISSFFSNRPLYNIDYMADVAFRKLNPLKIEKVLSHQTEFYVPVQNYDTLEIEYFSNRNKSTFIRNGKPTQVHSMSDINMYELIKASNAAPFVFDNTVELNGKRYVDAATLEPYILDLPALKGKRRIVIVTKNRKRLTKSLSYRLSGYLWPFLVAPFKRRKYKKDIYLQYGRKPDVMRKMNSDLETLERYDRTVVISPEFRLGAITDNSPETLEKNFDHGIQVVEKLRGEIASVLAM